MPHRLLFAVVVSLAASLPAAADAPTIDHQPLACAVAGRFPQLEARFAPAVSVAKARVQFQAEGERHWYGVAMKAAGPVFSAVLPKPKKSLKSYRYYIEVTDTALGTSRTAEYTTTVAVGRGACSDSKAAGGLTSAAVKLEVPPGAPAVPGGFSASGVIPVSAAGAMVTVAAGATAAGAAGGGIPAAVFIVGGVAAAGAGVAVAASAGGGGGGGGDGNGGGGGGSSTSYQGPFSGQFAITLFYAVPDARGSLVVCSGTSALDGTATVTLDAGGTVNGTIQTTGTHTALSGMCPKVFSASWTAPLTGSTGSLAARSERSFTSPNPAVTTSITVFEFSGALSGGAITGTLTFTYSEQAVDANGRTFSGSASVALPVTLRQR